MRKLLSAAALCLALPFVLLLSGCGAAVDGRSFNPTSNTSDGIVGDGGPDAANPPHVGFEIPDPPSNTGAGAGSAQTPSTGAGGSTQIPSAGAGSGSTQIPPIGIGSGSTQTPSAGSGSGSTQTPSTGSGSGSTQTPATGSGSGATQTPSTGSGSGSPQTPPTGSTPATGSGSTTPPASGSDPIEVDPTSGTAVLVWTAPTTNVDGSPVTELAGYAVAYGRSSGVLDQLITVSDARATSYTVEGLESGVWYFSVRALATSGTQSASSNIAATQID